MNDSAPIGKTTQGCNVVVDVLLINGLVADAFKVLDEMFRLYGPSLRVQVWACLVTGPKMFRAK